MVSIWEIREGNYGFLSAAAEMDAIQKAAKAAEDISKVNPTACVALCRRAAEFAVKWLVTYDPLFQLGYQKLEADALSNRDIPLDAILSAPFFYKQIGGKTLNYLQELRKNGNEAIHHADKTFPADKAVKHLEKLHYVLGHIFSRRYRDVKVPPFARDALPVLRDEHVPNAPSSGRLKPPFDFATHDSLNDSLASMPANVQEAAKKVIQQITKKRDFSSKPQPVGAVENHLHLVPVGVKHQLVVFAVDAVCHFLYVGETAAARQWASERSCEINPETKHLQIYQSSMAGKGDIAPEDDTPDESILDDLELPEDMYLLRPYGEETLCSLGVPVEYLSEVYKITSEEAWAAMAAKLPGEAYAAVSAVLQGISVERAIRETFGNVRKPMDPEDYGAAAAQDQVGVAKVESDEALEAMLNAPLDKWRVYLHPQQRHIAYRSYQGPARVLGGAGTGKSVVAIHHAKYLADETAPNYRILFTTYTKNLTSDIEARLDTICSPESRGKIHVVNIDKLVSRLLEKLPRGNQPRLLFGESLDTCWEQAHQAYGALPEDLPLSMIKGEWEYVIMAQGINSREGYLQADRQGRAVRLDKHMRNIVWDVCRIYFQRMTAQNRRDRDWACNQLITEMKNGKLPASCCYDSIIVDEIPDFGPAQFRLLRALVGGEHPDDLFLTGDPRQRIYAMPQVVLAQCGINIRGRSHQLVMNYRTTGPILKWANQLLTGTHMDDLDGGQGDTDPSISAFAGEMPKLIQYATPEQEMERVAEEVNRLMKMGTQLKEIAVIARHNTDLYKWMDYLEHNGISTNLINNRNNAKASRNPYGVALATMHGCKGLEYSYVFVVGVNAASTIQKEGTQAGNENEERETQLAEVRTLHVAITRARKAVQVSYSGIPSYTLQRLMR